MNATNIVERMIARRLVEDLLGKGFEVDVNVDGDDVLIGSRDRNAILAAMFSADEERLFVRRAQGDANHVEAGWVYLVYGNNGFDVISDYTSNLEAVVRPIHAISDQLEEGQPPLDPIMCAALGYPTSA